MFSTSIPASSRISRRTHSSKVSPASTKPARTLKKTEGKRRAWARRIFPSRTTATMTAGADAGIILDPAGGAGHRPLVRHRLGRHPALAAEPVRPCPVHDLEGAPGEGEHLLRQGPEQRPEGAVVRFAERDRLLELRREARHPVHHAEELLPGRKEAQLRGIGQEGDLRRFSPRPHQDVVLVEQEPPPLAAQVRGRHDVVNESTLDSFRD